MGPKPLTIAIDYDDTFTADPLLFEYFMMESAGRGHKVICVTARHYTPENKEELKSELPKGTLIYFTGHRSKMEYMAEQGIIPNIWIDDQPKVVVHGV